MTAVVNIEDPPEPEPIIQGDVRVIAGPGQLLSAQARASADFKKRIEGTIRGGTKRSADHVTGFRHGWDAAIAYLRAIGAIR